MADVSIDGTISANTARGVRAIVFHPTDPLIGYMFYSDGDADFSYCKTTDGGGSWGTPVQIGIDDTHIAFDVWPDWYTPGGTGTLIHMVWFGTSADDVMYGNLDISDDSLSTPVVVEAQSTAAAGIGAMCSITKARNGDLHISWNLDSGSELGHERSTDGGASWTARALFHEAATDWCFLYPATGTGDDADVWALYHDHSVDSLTLKQYDDSANTISESANITNVTDNTSNLVGCYPYAGAVRHSDGALIAVACTVYDNVTGDCRVFEILGTSSITELTAIAIDTDDIYYPSVFIDQNTDDIYVALNGNPDGSEAIGTATHIWYTRLPDGSSTWDTPAQYSEGSASAKLQTWTPLMGPRFYVAWRDGTTLVGNAVNSLDLSAAGGGDEYIYAATGGAQAGGAAVLVKEKSAQVSGGATLAGAAVVSSEKVAQVSGGITTGGTAVSSFTEAGTIYTWAAVGGVSIAGAAISSKEKSAQVAGGVVLAGGAVFSKEKSASVSGGLIAAGTAAVSTLKVPQTDGGVSAAGAAVLSSEKAFASGGGLAAGGAAVSSFIEAGVPQTWSCVATGGISIAGAASASHTIGTPAVIEKGNGDRDRLWRPPQPARRYRASGGLALGGAAAVSFAPAKVETRPAPAAPPVATVRPQRATVKLFHASGGLATGGAAVIQFHDHRRYVQRIDQLDMDLAA